jgi:excisionase family DNA binding protein
MPKQRKLSDLIRATDAARILGVSRPTVLAMVARHELAAAVVGGLTFVSRADALRVAETRQGVTPKAA